MVTRVPSSPIPNLATNAADLYLLTLRQEAENGVADSQYELGVRYEKGDGVTADLVEAAKWVSIGC